MSKSKKVKIKQGIVHVGLKGFTDLNEALAHNTLCGAGIDPIKGMVVLPNYNSSSGDIDGFYAVTIVDGEIALYPAETFRQMASGYKCNPLVSATGVIISGCPTGSVDVEDGTFTLAASVQPSSALQTGTWTSLQPLIATVSSAGVVTPLAAGTATIRFTSTDGNFIANCTITVTED
jgi:uncharacterized protein YjdB